MAPSRSWAPFHNAPDAAYGYLPKEGVTVSSFSVQKPDGRRKQLLAPEISQSVKVDCTFPDAPLIGSTWFEVPGSERDCQISNRVVRGFSTTVRNHRPSLLYRPDRLLGIRVTETKISLSFAGMVTL